MSKAFVWVAHLQPFFVMTLVLQISLDASGPNLAQQCQKLPEGAFVACQWAGIFSSDAHPEQSAIKDASQNFPAVSDAWCLT